VGGVQSICNLLLSVLFSKAYVTFELIPPIVFGAVSLILRGAAASSSSSAVNSVLAK